MIKQLIIAIICSALLANAGNRIPPSYRDKGNAFLEEAEATLELRKAEIINTESDWTLGEGGTIFYISNNGNDKNSGTSPDEPWQTVLRLEVMQHNGNVNRGDVVLFERGGEWRERWSAKAGVSYSAYGEGPKPIFNGNELGNAADPLRWTLVEGTNNIWKYTSVIVDVGNIVYNDGEKTVTKLLPEIHQKTHYINGKKFDPTTSFTDNDTFMCEYLNIYSEGADVQTSPSRLYVRCDEGNPGEVYDSIEIVYRGNLISGASNTLFDNLCIKYSGSHGIGMGTVGNVTVQNCEVGYIGGSAQYWHSNGYIIRYGNGIEVYGGCDNFTVDNCYVYQCYDAGITHQYSPQKNVAVFHEDVNFTNNVIEKCIYNIEYFMSDTANEEEISKLINVLYKNNIFAYSGMGWGMDPSRSASIKGWDYGNRSENFVIEDNLFILDKVNACDLGAGDDSWLPTFRNNTYIQKFGNTFTRIGTFGNNQHYFNLDSAEILESKVGETGAKLYFVE